MMHLAATIAAAYVLTFLAASAAVFNRPRRWLVDRTPWLQPRPMRQGSSSPPHPFICRMCLGFWISLAAAAITGENFFIIYGASYFLATQER